MTNRGFGSAPASQHMAESFQCSSTSRFLIVNSKVQSLQPPTRIGHHLRGHHSPPGESAPQPSRGMDHMLLQGHAASGVGKRGWCQASHGHALPVSFLGWKSSVASLVLLMPQLRHHFLVLKVNLSLGLESEVGGQEGPPVPFGDLLTHAAGTRLPVTASQLPARFLNENVLPSCHSSIIIHSQDAWRCLHIIWDDTEQSAPSSVPRMAGSACEPWSICILEEAEA